MHWEGNSKRTYCDERLLIKSKNAILSLLMLAASIDVLRL